MSENEVEVTGSLSEEHQTERVQVSATPIQNVRLRENENLAHEAGKSWTQRTQNQDHLQDNQIEEQGEEIQSSEPRTRETPFEEYQTQTFMGEYNRVRKH